MKISKSLSTTFVAALVAASSTRPGQAYVGPTSREVLVRIGPGRHSIEAHNGDDAALPFIVLSTGTLRMVGVNAKLAKANVSTTAEAADGGSIKEYLS